MTTPNDTVVRTEDLWKIYGHDGITVNAVRGVSITIRRGEFVVLAGPSGSGKTTVLNLIGGLTRPSKGRVFLEDQDLTTLSQRALAELRLKRLGFVFQAYNLLPVLSAAENAELPMMLRGGDAVERRRRVTELFNRIGLNGLEDRRPGQLSGGQQQRVAVARAVLGEPALVLADEPTANLDSEASGALLDVMEGLNRDLGTTFVFSTHDQRLIERAPRVIRLVDGAVASDEKA